MPPPSSTRQSDAVQQQCIFWGKFVEDGPACLPLVAHCLDVALVFRGLCDLDAVQRVLTQTGGGQLHEYWLDRLAVLAMIHDIGKANLGFQMKVFDAKAPRAGHIRELSLLLDVEVLDSELHEAFVQCLPEGMFNWFADDICAYSYFMASFSHHGRPLKFKGEKMPFYFDAKNKWWLPLGQWDPMDAIKQIIEWAKTAFPSAFRPDGVPLPSNPRFHHRFAGLVMLADWLGSHGDWFPVQATSLDERLRHGRELVPQLLQVVGLDIAHLRPVLASGPATFTQRFQVPSARPLQGATDLLDLDDENTRLVIAESETGSGKTEAALNWFYRLFVAGKVDSLYFALPTRVAAREIYERVRQVIHRWFPDPQLRPITVLAVPGYAQSDSVPKDRLLPDETAANRWQDDEDLVHRERHWAAEHPKRFLAATVAVGTVDQALLSAVQTAHAHLRSVCLDRSLLVVDEVHASDHYMTRLLRHLLEHHLGVGGRAMLLSATLGARTRHALANRSSNNSAMPTLAEAQSAPYPSITLADGVPRATSGGDTGGKTIWFHIVPLAFNPEGIVSRLASALADGARVLVVMNTVQRANALLKAMEAHPDLDPRWLFRYGDTVCPHHGRFAPADRLVLDKAVSDRFGRHSPPGPILLVGSQTLEQSLDIDADLIITDLAPADVLLQRVGRLHRHERERPAGYESAKCLVLTPEEDLATGLDEKGRVAGQYKRLGYGSVYEDLRTLELTRCFLVGKPEIKIPDDNRRFVEAATHPESLNSLTEPRWQAHGMEIEGGDLARAVAAGLAAAAFDKLFGEVEFNEAGGRVATRLGAGNLQLTVDKPFPSPFGQVINSIVIPAHMAPQPAPDTVIHVAGAEGDTTYLQYGKRKYSYGRYGLEVAP